jgi:DNA-directed RNA polymerase specialized sigma24 family protein
LLAKDYLKQVRKLDSLIKNKLIEKQQWMDVALGITPQISADRVQSSGNQQKMASAVDKCIEIEQELDEYVDKLIEKKREILSVLEQLSPKKYDVMHAVYVQFQTFGETAYSMNKSYSWVKGTHSKAIKEVQRIIDNMEEQNV